MKKKALILYISKYSGHYQGAKAIEKGILQINPQAEVATINAIDYTNPILGKIINKTYLEIIKKKPEFWGNIYDNPDVLKKTKKAREAIHRYNMSKIKRLMEKYQPEVVICTQAFPCGMVADYKRTTGKEIPLIGVLTDHAPHSYWLHDEVDHFIVPSDDVAEALRVKGVSGSRIKTCGIPIDPKFCNEYEKKGIVGEFGLKADHPIVLIMGGSQGIGAMEEVTKELLGDAKHEYQLLVISGKNKGLYKRLRKVEKRNDGHMKVLPYVENIDEVMEASDVIITKAGGLTTAEALVKGLPLLIVKPIPGHERKNTDFLVGEKVAIEIEDMREIHHILNRMFDNRDMLEGMVKKAKDISRPESSLDIAKLALKEA